MSRKGTIMHITTRINSTYTSTITTCRCSLSTCRDTTDASSTRCAGCRRNWSGEPTKYPAPVLLLYCKATKGPLLVKFPNHKGECQDLLESELAVLHAGNFELALQALDLLVLRFEVRLGCRTRTISQIAGHS